MAILANPVEAIGRLTGAARAVGVLRRSGLVRPSRPDLAIASVRSVRRYGPIAGAARIAARRDRSAVAIVDERGTLTYADLDRRSNALARAWAAHGLGADSVIAVLCRDHRGVVDTMLAAAKLGARLLLMNTGFGAPQLADVAAREGVSALVHDQEFTPVLSRVPAEVRRYLAWVDEPGTGVPCLDELIASTEDRDVPAPRQAGGLVLLTSGTTGTPKGAPRRVRSPLAAAQFLDRIPLRAGEATFVAAPTFHGTGLSQFILSFALGSAVIFRRRFDALSTLDGVARYRCTALVLVPTMLRRILDLGPETLAEYDTSSLRVLFSVGSALPADLGNRATQAFGEVVHNLYGSTEVAVATVATPEDWRAAPGTVGRPPLGCRVKLFDAGGEEVTEPGVRGRIFAGSALAFEGYSGGGHKEIIDGLLSSGDIGHFDASGRLFVDGRDDDMIVSGGENVFPGEIEDLLAAREDVLEAAVIGVPDREFGHRLRAFVVPAPDRTLDAEEIKAYVKGNLARYKVPRDVVFLAELPRNATGKLLRARLRTH
ncbi:acyl-CoA synthetase [Amycolatopsis anabasis]|uniref:acyl-CoA synthetase n=1 Tax=Amycolatopsis anabasis TaxID=1840409 RepID=UPI00131AA989|nr:acyl-CoA synthetase [Amycolatopsis anabasis]